MDAFFEARLAGYEEHMLQNIEGAGEFYPFTARHLPTAPGAAILDLGCGTGLELNWYFRLNPTARVTGIDLSARMLDQLGQKFPGKGLELIQGSYFDVPLGENRFDGAVSVESLHHFTQAEKIPLYTRLHAALKDSAAFVLTDYFARDEAEEQALRRELLRLKEEQGIPAADFYHFDTPLTVEHETQALTAAGFRKIEILGRWAATVTLRAVK